MKMTPTDECDMDDRTLKQEEKNLRFKALSEYYQKLNEIDAFNSNFYNNDMSNLNESEGGGSGIDSVTNRVAGFVLKKILSEHTACVTSLVVVESKENNDEKYLMSAGWDRRICIWSLNDNNIRLFDIFRNKNAQNFDEVELASDGNILDMCYATSLNQFAYACSDSMCYIRKFSKHGTEMKLVNTLLGHLSDVNCIKWIEHRNCWITGGQDSTIRIWVCKSSSFFRSLQIWLKLYSKSNQTIPS
jgi:WD40 repeat protein